MERKWDAMEDSGDARSSTSPGYRVYAIVESTTFAMPLSADRNLVNYKALLARRFIDGEKTGLISTRNPVGRAAQSVVSAIIPGNQSTIRHPIRSQIYSAITPGGGNDRRNRRDRLGIPIGRGSDGPLRCPAGFENGGRFATRGFGNCGRQLFGLLGSGSGGGGGRGAGGGRTDTLGVIRREGDPLGDGSYGSRSIQIERNAQIPRTGGANAQKFSQGLNSAVTTLANPETSGALLVRRDGQILRPTVSAAVLAEVDDNPDMIDAALVVATASPADIGKEGVPSIWKSRVRQISYALPGGGTLTLRRNGSVGTVDKRKLTRAWARSSSESDGEFDYGIRLRRFAEESNGKIDYVENFPNTDGPNDSIIISRASKNPETASVQRWVYATYLSDTAPGRNPKTPAWNEIEESSDNASIDTTTIRSVADAVKRLDDNGNPEEIPSDYLGDALNKTKSFKKSTIRPGVQLLERGDGKKWFRITSDESFAHLSEKISSDVNAAMGLEAPPVKFIGTGAKRDYLIAHAQNAVDSQLERRTVERMDPKDLMRVVVADWLVDNRDRSPGSLISGGKGAKSRLIPSSNPGSALSGLSGDELRKRRNLVLGEFLAQSLNATAAERYRSLVERQRKILADLYGDLLKRATDFNWDDYTSRLGLDGELSAGEEAHLELVKKLFENRLKQLRSSRKRFLVGVGIS